MSTLGNVVLPIVNQAFSQLRRAGRVWFARKATHCVLAMSKALRGVLLRPKSGLVRLGYLILFEEVRAPYENRLLL